MRSLVLALLSGSLCLTSSPALARTWHVPGDIPTIKAAVDTSVAGDTVVVACGTYYEFNILLKSGMCLRSEDGLASCVTIDAEQQGRIFLCNRLDSTTTIQGFTATGGLAPPTWPAFMGGGAICIDSSPRIISCDFIDNVTAGVGGGMICLDGSSPNLTNCVFDQNRAGNGGGLSCQTGSHPTLVACTFTDNWASEQGAGVTCSQSSPTLVGCTFSGNWAGERGAGMWCWSSSPHLTDCIFHLNEVGAGGEGGAVYCLYASSPQLAKCTLVGNSAGAGGVGGAVYCENNSSPVIHRGILALSTAGEAVHCFDAGCNPALSCCDLYGNADGDWVGCIADQESLAGNFSADPYFCDLTGGDLQLLPCSPCADAPGCGQVGALGVGCSPRAWFVATTGSDSTGDGTPGNPLASIGKGLESASPCDTVTVVSGTYYEHDLAMKSGVTLRSEAGTMEAVVVDAQGLGRVVCCEGVQGPARIEGFTLRGGDAGASPPDSSGGGILCRSSSLSMAECILEDNTAQTGGGLSCTGGSVVLADSCLFRGNSALGRGGALSSTNGSLPTLTNTVFSGNSAADAGGAVSCTDADPELYQCTLYGNEAVNAGGGLALSGSSSALLENTVITHGPQGEAVWCNGTGGATLLCCDVYGNAGGDWVGCIAGQEGLAGNISADPYFCDEAGEDFYLLPCSPCADAPGCGRLGTLGVGCSPRSWYVSTTGNDSTGDGTPGNPLASIGKGLESASPCDTVLVVSGAYSEHDLIMKSGITLRSEVGAAEAVVLDAQGLGRVIYCADVQEPARIEGFTLRGGDAGASPPDSSGGALYCGSASLSVTDCVLEANTGRKGGGLSCLDSSSFSGRNLTFSQNSAASDGGGLRCSGGSIATLDSCLFSSNSAADAGGAISSDGANPELHHCTLYGNEAANSGGGLALGGSSSALLENTIISSSTQGEAVWCDGSSGAALTCCDLYGNAGGDWIGCIADQEGVDGNFSADPMFCDPDSGNLLVDSRSPCLPGQHPDGADCGQIGVGGEGCAPRVYVSESGDDLFCDGSPGCPFRSIRRALAEASYGDTVLVAAGFYPENDTLLAGIRVSGGWDTTFTWRDPLQNPSVVHGGCQGPVVYCGAGIDTTTELSGMTLTGGCAAEGGGILCVGASPRIEDCVIQGNKATASGGGVACLGGSRPAIHNTIIDSNQVTQAEAALVPAGGGIYCSASPCTLRNCVILRNFASDNGGGLACLDGSDSRIENTLFWGNQAVAQGGAVYEENSSPTLTNVSLVENEARLGAGLRLVAGSVELRNSIVAFSLDGEGLLCTSGATTAVTYSCFWANEGGEVTGCGPLSPTDTIRADPVFADLASGDFHLGACSPSIDAGNPDPAQNDPDGSRNDMGAYGGPGTGWDPASPPRPERTRDLAARADSAAIALWWSAHPPAESVDRFHVWRDTTADLRPRCGEEVGTPADTALVDSTSVMLDESYWYIVQAVDSSGHAGGLTPPRRVDTALRHDGALDIAFAWLEDEAGVLEFLRGNFVAAGAGLEGTGSDTITITGIPAGATVEKALLYWQGWSGSEGVVLDTLRTGFTVVGKDGDAEALRADVTEVVTAKRNGSYLVTAVDSTAGASLVVVWTHPDSAQTLLVISDGLENGGDSEGGQAWLDKIYLPFCPGDSITEASVCYIIGGGDPAEDDKYGIYQGDGDPLVLQNDGADGSDGVSWDTDRLDVLSALPDSGGVEPAFSVYEGTDALDWVALILEIENPPCVGERVSVASVTELPRTYALAPAGANPFPPGGVLRLALPRGSETSLEVFDVTGRRVRSLVRRGLPPGNHLIAWDGRDDRDRPLAAGVYFARAQAGDWQKVVKIVLAR